MLAGCGALEAPRVAALLDRFRFLPMDAPVADEAARNLKDFRPPRFAFVFVPYAVRG